MLRELMALMGATAQEIVTMARSAFAGVGGAAAALAGTGARPRTDPAHEIAEAVMGREAWDAYKNLEYKTMTGSRRPQGSATTKKHVTARNKKLGCTLVGWSLQVEPQHFAGVDTRWRMDHTLTWLPPNGDVTGAHVETLGNMISEAFHKHKRTEREKRLSDKNKARKKSSTAAEASEWDVVTSVKGNDFFKTKK